MFDVGLQIGFRFLFFFRTFFSRDFKLALAPPPAALACELSTTHS